MFVFCVVLMRNLSSHLLFHFQLLKTVVQALAGGQSGVGLPPSFARDGLPMEWRPYF